MLLLWHPMNITLMCSLTYCYYNHPWTANFAVTNPEEALKHDSPGRKFCSWQTWLIHDNKLGLKNYTLWQTWKEAPIFLTGRIGVDKMLAKETTFDNPRFLLFSCSGGKDVSSEHTLTASLILLLRFLCNNVVNYFHLSQPRKTETEPTAVKCWKESNMTMKRVHSFQNMQETADVTFF